MIFFSYELRLPLPFALECPCQAMSPPSDVGHTVLPRESEGPLGSVWFFFRARTKSIPYAEAAPFPLDLSLPLERGVFPLSSFWRWWPWETEVSFFPRDPLLCGLSFSLHEIGPPAETTFFFLRGNPPRREREFTRKGPPTPPLREIPPGCLASLRFAIGEVDFLRKPLCVLIPLPLLEFFWTTPLGGFPYLKTPSVLCPLPPFPCLRLRH